MATVQEEVWEILRKLALSSEETNQKMRETDRKLKEVTTAIGRLGNRLGEFVEEMVRPSVVRLFQQRGIAIPQVFRGAYAERDGDAMEIGLLVGDDLDAVLVEVKSELKADDVKDHVSRLERFKKLCPQYAGFRVMGAVAAWSCQKLPPASLTGRGCLYWRKAASR